MLVKNIMKSEVAACHVDTNLESVALLMWNHDCGAIPVVDSADRPIGIVTDRDITMACSLNNRPLWDMRAGDVIGARPLYACMEDDDLDSALNLMRDYQIRRLPVTDRSERLVGILSMSDMIRLARQSHSGEDAEEISLDQLTGTLRAVSEPRSEKATMGAP